MTNAKPRWKYGKIITNGRGKDTLCTAPDGTPEDVLKSRGFLPIRNVARRDPTKKAVGWKPVRRDGYIELAWRYEGEE